MNAMGRTLAVALAVLATVSLTAIGLMWTKGQVATETVPAHSDGQPQSDLSTPATGSFGSPGRLVPDDSPRPLVEPIPKSAFHSPDGTWWGYNQSKIVRFGDLVFMYIIVNSDDHTTTTSDFTLYVKRGNGQWEQGAAFPTSRPGNLLIDSRGVLHAFVFEPTAVQVNDSLGRLQHYWFPEAAKGDIRTVKSEVVVDQPGTIETVNIRVGAAIGSDDTLVIGFGLTAGNPPNAGHSQHVYFKKPTEAAWQHAVAGDNLGHDFFYPFVLATVQGFHLLSVQDDYYLPPGATAAVNIYQKIMYFGQQPDGWERTLLADLTAHPLASTRYRLLEQSDFLADAQGHIHVVYKEFLDPQSPWRVSRMVHMIQANGAWQSQDVDLRGRDVNWVRLLTVDGQLFYLFALYDGMFVQRVGGRDWYEVPLAGAAVQGYYPYVATDKGGTRATTGYVDVALHAASPVEYGVAQSLYVRIPRAVFAGIR